MENMCPRNTSVGEGNHRLLENESIVQRHMQIKNEEIVKEFECKIVELTIENDKLKEDIKCLRIEVSSLESSLQKSKKDYAYLSGTIFDLEEKLSEKSQQYRKSYKNFGAETIENKKLIKNLTESYEKKLLKATDEKKSSGAKVNKLEAQNFHLLQQVRFLQQQAIKNQMMEKSQDDNLSTKIDALQNDSYFGSKKEEETPNIRLLESKHLSPSQTTQQKSSVESLKSETDYEPACPETLIDSHWIQTHVFHTVSKEPTRSPETPCMIIHRLVYSWFQIELNFIKILTNYFIKVIKYMITSHRSFFNNGTRHYLNVSNSLWTFLLTKFFLIASTTFVFVLACLRYLFRYRLFEENPSSDSKEPLQEQEVSHDSGSQYSDEMDEQEIAQFQSPTYVMDSDYSENETERGKESSLSESVKELPTTSPKVAKSCENYGDAAILANKQMVNNSLLISFLVSCWEKIQAWNLFGKDQRQTYRYLLNLNDKPEVLPTMIEILPHFLLYGIFYILLKDLGVQVDHTDLYCPKTIQCHSYGWTRQLPISEVSAAELDGLILRVVKSLGVEVKSFPLPG